MSITLCIIDTDEDCVLCPKDQCIVCLSNKLGCEIFDSMPTKKEVWIKCKTIRTIKALCECKRKGG